VSHAERATDFLSVCAGGLCWVCDAVQQSPERRSGRSSLHIQRAESFAIGVVAHDTTPVEIAGRQAVAGVSRSEWRPVLRTQVTEEL
jgi:hypothetical protein